MKFVPITSTKFRCRGKCCFQEYVPLGLAYAQTIHRFQGLSAGPADDGEAPNMFDAIVCDPDGSHFEAQFPGLLYTAVSSATTLGASNELDSALYFTGKSITHDRLNRTGKYTGTPGWPGWPQNTYRNIHFRSEWVQHLRDNIRSSCLTTIQKENLFTWAEGTSINYSDLIQRVNEYQQVCPSKPTNENSEENENAADSNSSVV